MPDISPKVLTSTLKTLETDGLIHRELFPCIPPKVEYSITALGKELADIVNQLALWGLRHSAEIKKSRSMAEKKSGN